MNRRRTSIAAGAFGVVAIVGCTDSHDVKFYNVERCITDGGGTVGDDAELVWVDGWAVDIVGDVKASDELLAECLDPMPVITQG